MKHVLVCCDLSGDSVPALEVARSFAEQDSSTALTLLFVVDTPVSYVAPVGLGPGWVDLEPVVKEIEKRAVEKLRSLAEQYFPGKNVRREVRRSGEAIYEEITKFAESEGVDLIVMSKHGKSGMQRLLLGSVTTKVVQLAHCPVLIVPPKKGDGVVK